MTQVRPVVALQDFHPDSRETLQQMIRDIKAGKADHLLQRRRPGNAPMSQCQAVGPRR
ncbi:hypothetical protein ACFYSJ_01280 [Streptomyces sp. NPDC005248]|uniref:hypothetical protein n=1 Tax=unclassified Streptomyces TaxID=2593676 RepID=UPI0033BD950D